MPSYSATYHYTDTPFQNRVIRLIRADDGQALHDGLIAVQRQAQQERPDVVALIKDGHKVYHAFRNSEDRDLWDAFLKQYPLLQDEYYQWTRAQDEA